MDNRYRSSGGQQGQRDRFGGSRQSEQFSEGSQWQEGDDSWRSQENRQGWQSEEDRGGGYGRNENLQREDFSRSGSGFRSDVSAFDDYDRAYGGSRFGPQDREQRVPYGRSGSSYGAGDFTQSRNTTGYGADRYGSSSVGSGSYRPDGYGRRDHAIPPRQYDRDERGFFDRASDEVMSWFGDDDAARRRQLDAREDHRGKGPSGYNRSKERILEDANERLMHDSSVDASNITVACENDEITLSGTVDSRQAKRRAEDIVENVSGVKHVQNNLRVQASGTSYYSETTTPSDS